MLNTICSYTGQAILFSQQNLNLSVSPQHKRITAIVALALCCLAACYALVKCYRRRQNNDDSRNNPTVQPAPKVAQPTVDPKVKNSEESFEKAIDFMFHDRRLEWEASFDASKLTPQQRQERHEELKRALADILPQHIDATINYRDGMMTRAQTLLLQAIMHIREPELRLEIVQILLAKGADPDVQGFCYQPVMPMQEALETKDQQLVAVLQNAKQEILKKKSAAQNVQS